MIYYTFFLNILLIFFLLSLSLTLLLYFLSPLFTLPYSLHTHLSLHLLLYFYYQISQSLSYPNFRFLDFLTTLFLQLFRPMSSLFPFFLYLLFQSFAFHLTSVSLAIFSLYFLLNYVLDFLSLLFFFFFSHFAFSLQLI